MATMTEPKAGTKTLVRYMVESGVAILELDDPPANTYTHEMMRQLDDAILKARFDDSAHVIVRFTGPGTTPPYAIGDFHTGEWDAKHAFFRHMGQAFIDLFQSLSD